MEYKSVESRMVHAYLLQSAPILCHYGRILRRRIETDPMRQPHSR